MKHLGDITKINGAEIPAVDVITGGSPCQDLSVAGLRKGIQHEDNGDDETTRSGLFMDQLRIVKEMRENERRNGRNGLDVRPRYMVWENVPGAFSVNQGKDFQAVLTKIVRVIEPTAPDVPLPEKGWPYAGCIYDELGGWSIAYRVHDAQFWGVPQRRRRIALVADFNGLSAAEILFDPQLRGETESSQPDQAVADPGAERRSKVQPLSQSLSGDSEPGGEAWEGTAESSAGCSDGTGEIPVGLSFQERAGCDGGARESFCNVSGQEPCQPSETSTPSQSSDDQDDAYSIQGNTIDRAAKQNGGGYLPGPIVHAEQRGPSRRMCGGLSERDRKFFREWHSASKEAGAKPQQQQCCKSAETESGGGIAHQCPTHSGIKQTATTGKTVKPISPSPAEMMSAGFKPRNSAVARSIGYEVERSPTINTDENYATHIRYETE